MVPKTIAAPQPFTEAFSRHDEMTDRSGVSNIDSSVREVASAQEVPRMIKPVAVLARPVALKVVRPIPQRVSQQFYNSACEEGLSMQEMQQAAMVAHDWHRKWTQQDEQGHTLPHEDFYAHQYGEDEAVVVFDPRQEDMEGAKNPSLGGSVDESDEEQFRRGLELEASRLNAYAPSPCEDDMPVSPRLLDRQGVVSMSTCVKSSVSSSLSSYMGPHDDCDFDEPPIVVPTAVRPVAVRIARPVVPLDSIPCNVNTGSVCRDISPMSFSDNSMSSEDFMVTLANRRNVVREDDESEYNIIPKPSFGLSSNLITARDGLLHALAASQGDVDSDMFKAALNPLLKHFNGMDTRLEPTSNVGIEGMWLTLSKPSYFSCLGDNDNGDPMYTLGRMAFDMFSPTNLVCSLQGNFNPVEIVDEEERKTLLEKVPKSLREEVESGNTVLRTYHIMAAFTVEPSQALFPTAPNKDVYRPIRGIMTTYGYSLPDPKEPNRHSIWFTGGRIEPNNDPVDIMAWKKLFTKHPPNHSFGEKAKLLAVKLLMGATVPETMAEDGSMEYEFTRPLGGHGMAYVDVVYLDETLRIMKGHRGTVFVFSRMQH